MYERLFRRAVRFYRRARKLPPIVFMHVPKTGGTSLEAVLNRLAGPRTEGNVQFGSVTNGLMLARSMRATGGNVPELTWLGLINSVACYKIAERAPLVAGHFCVTRELIEGARPPYVFVTLLRDPVERWISNYIYSRIREAQKGERTAPPEIRAELAEYLESAKARREGAKYVHYLGGFRDPESLGDAASVEAARATLERFDVVGVLDDMAELERRLSRVLRRRIHVPHLRKTTNFREPNGYSASDYKALFTPEIRERVRELCAPDYAIYQHARQLP